MMQAIIVIGIFLCVCAVLVLIWGSPGSCCQDCQQGRSCVCDKDE